MVESTDAVHALRRDLQDGEDLALAVRLVADALDRRLDRVRRSLDHLARSDPGAAEGLAGRLSDRIEQHQLAVEHHREQLEDAVDHLQRVMQTTADELQD